MNLLSVKNSAQPGKISLGYRLFLAFAMIIAFSLTGCTSAKFVSTGQSYDARPDDCNIEVFTTKTPDREYEELGIIEGEGSFGADSFADVLPKIKQKACRAGGDAIILLSNQKSVNVSGSDNFIDSDEKLNVTVTVIRWKE